jgi:hypothetical protein
MQWPTTLTYWLAPRTSWLHGSFSFVCAVDLGHVFHEAASQLWSHSIVPTDNLTRTLKACPCMHLLAPPGCC